MHDPNKSSDRPGMMAWRMIEPYWRSVSIYDGAIIFLNGFETMPLAARHLFAVKWCDSEVCNGGFHQFFSNSTGVLGPEALEGFRTIGLTEFAEFVGAAIGKFDEPYPRDQAARREALSALRHPGVKRKEWDVFYEIDNLYYAAKRQSKFYESLDDYARRSG